jgi:hypothetical protein
MKSVPQQLFDGLELRIGALANLQNPSAAERENLWNAAVDTYYRAIPAGHKAVQVKKDLAERLWSRVPALGKSESAIFRQIYRKIDRVAEVGYLADKRRESAQKKRAPMLTKEDRAALIQQAVFECGGSVDFAWQECLRKKLFSAELLKRYSVPKKRRPRCPKAIRRQVAPEIAALYQHHVRPHYNSNNVVPMTRDWSKVCAQDRYEIDDKTLDVRCRLQHEENGMVKEKIIRPQMLLVIDSKSGKALGKVLIAENNYNSRAAKTLCRNVFKKTGLCGEFLMECGLWKRAKLLGNNPTRKAFEEVENFCTRIGVILSHAIPGRARTKTIEGRFRSIDRLMFGLPGYIGRDEMHIKFERVTDADLLTFDELDRKLDELLNEYNDRPQDSKIMGGYYTPNEVWKNCRRKNADGEVEPVTFVAPQFEYLLTNHCEVAKVGLAGVRFSVASETYQYFDERLVDFVGGCLNQQVKVWFDPESPETAVVTNMNGTDYFPARRIPEAPAAAQTKEDWLQVAKAAAPYRNALRQIRERYSVIKLGYIAPARTTVADIETINRAQQMADTKEKAINLNQRATAESFEENQQRRKVEKTVKKWEAYDRDMELYQRDASIFDFRKPLPPDCPRPGGEDDSFAGERPLTPRDIADFVNSK